MPAQQHLPHRPAVQEDHRWKSYTRSRRRRQKQLSVNGEAAGGRDQHLPGDNQLCRREIAGQQTQSDWLAGGLCFYRPHVGHRGPASVRSQIGNGCGVACYDRTPFDALAPGKLLGCATAQRDSPEMPPINVAAIRGINNCAVIRGEGHVLEFALPGRKQRRGAAGCRNRVEMLPASCSEAKIIVPLAAQLMMFRPAIPGKDSSRKSVLCHTGRAELLATSATQMAQDSGRSGAMKKPTGVSRGAAARRTKATCFPSADHLGNESVSTEGAR